MPLFYFSKTVKCEYRKFVQFFFEVNFLLKAGITVYFFPFLTRNIFSHIKMYGVRTLVAFKCLSFGNCCHFLSNNRLVWKLFISLVICLLFDSSDIYFRLFLNWKIGSNFMAERQSKKEVKTRYQSPSQKALCRIEWVVQ